MTIFNSTPKALATDEPGSTEWVYDKTYGWYERPTDLRDLTAKLMANIDNMLQTHARNIDWS